MKSFLETTMRWIVLALLASTLACRVPSSTHVDRIEPATEGASPSAVVHAPQEPEAPRPQAAEPTPNPAISSAAGTLDAKPRSDPSASTPIEPTAAHNRDKHGNADIDRYIATLQSEKRIADLQVDVVIAKLALPPDAVVGDLGCGPGIFVSAFSKACPDGIVYASDIEPRQLDAVRERIHKEKLTNVVPVLSSYDDPHFPPERLDVVFIGDTYHHLEDRVAYVQRLTRVLRPGGRVVLLDYKPGKLPVGPGPEHKLAAGVMEKEMTAAGYKRVAKFDTHPYQDFEIWRVVQDWEKK